MERKYAVITGFLGRIRDRFIDYQPSREIDEIVALAAKIKGCAGLEVVYPQDFGDPGRLKALLAEFNLGVSTVNLNIKADEIWRFGTFSSPDPKVRAEAVRHLREAMDFSVELGCNIVTTAPINDGSDYPFELDYVRAFHDTVACVREAADYRPGVRISLEYKASEPRIHCLLNNAGKMAYFCEMVDRPNVGVTLDLGHAFQAKETPADSIAFLGSTGKLFYLHINDNYRDWDWDLVPGAVNFWEYLESVLYLKRVGYAGWMTADVFPGRNDPVRTFEKTFEWMDFICDLADRVDETELFARMSTNDAFGMLDYVRERTGGLFPAK